MQVLNSPAFPSSPSVLLVVPKALNTWETLTPRQQQQEEEELEGLVEEAVESGDMLCLAELPGAFRIYR